MKLLCPQCQTALDAADINITTDLAKCIRCNQVFKASQLAADADLREDIDPPAGSTITFDSSRYGRGSFTIKKRGVSGSDAFMILFATFWISFITLWTWGAYQGSALFALFSIPFWFVGIGLWRGIIVGITESQKIQPGDDSLTITKKSLLSSKQVEIPYNEISAIDLNAFTPRNPFTMTRYMSKMTRSAGSWGAIPLATVVHGTKKTHFAETVSEAESKWLVKMLKAFVFKQTGKRV